MRRIIDILRTRPQKDAEIGDGYWLRFEGNNVVVSEMTQYNGMFCLAPYWEINTTLHRDLEQVAEIIADTTGLDA